MQFVLEIVFGVIFHAFSADLWSGLNVVEGEAMNLMDINCKLEQFKIKNICEVI